LDVSRQFYLSTGIELRPEKRNNPPMTIITDERCTEYSVPGHPERPARISKTLEKLRAQNELKLAWAEPSPVEDEILLRAHTESHLARVKEAASDFDGDTPAYPDIFDHASRGVGGALKALELGRAGEHAFSLLRPPGHHATRDRAMGFCYLSSIAIAALEALAQGVSKIAVFDFDVHHGNGTEAILLNHPHAVFASVHQHPCYPGTGTSDVGSNCFNFPVAPRTPREEHRKALEKGIEALLKFNPDMLAVSAGFDAYARDPIAQELLEAEDFHWLGETIRKLGLPVFSILEGGYSTDLPELIFAYLNGLEGK
jgi:acetoin utilization deacetylase AcuC-like enzyme